MSKKVIIFAATLFSLSAIWTAQPPKTAHALSGSDFKAGRIIDDTIFFNPNLIGGTQEIQAFLNSKVPVCDTWHASSDPNNQPPFICLKDYRQDTPNRAAETGLCSGFTGGNKSAAQIIFEVGQSCGVNPAALLVMLQKEQSLITDTWPWNIQYRSAMGYGCPDTAPCDAEYYGFFNQVYAAARQFKYYAKNPTYYNHRAGRHNNILYNPNSGCGSSSVYIDNQATAGLYNYTPYQPNQAALNNLYGTGDSCSAYGNRNFWRMFNDWFGSTNTSARVIVTRFDTTTDKTGTAATVGFSLNQPPSAPVTIQVQISDPAKAQYVSPSKITIYPETWNRPDLNTVIVYGLNNTEPGAHYYQLITLMPETTDSQFKLLTGESVQDITVTHLDKEALDVYRLHSPTAGLHHYTANPTERQNLVNSGYSDEGIAFSYCKSGENAIYRLRKGTSKTFLVHERSNELNTALAAGYNLELASFASSRGAGVPVYRLYNQAANNHFYTTSAAERDAALASGGYVSEGAPFEACASNQQPVYRLFNPRTGDHFYTTSTSERDSAGSYGYRHEGVGLYLCKTPDTLIYRLFNPNTGDHFYTASTAERDDASKMGYQQEGVAFQLCSQKDRAIQRLFNPQSGDHFYTQRTGEVQDAKQAGYQLEGTAFYTSP